MRTPVLSPISWFAGGYTSSTPEWAAWAFNVVMWAVPLSLVLWVVWLVYRTGPRPLRDAVLVWVTLGASAVFVGIAWPHDPAVLVPALLAAALSAGCTLRVRRANRPSLFTASVVAWVAWLPASLLLALALR